MSASRLIFFPANSHQITDKSTLISALINAQFIDDANHAENHYLPGERFLNLLTFLGCSPNINLQPTQGEQHCFISVIDTSSEVRYLGSTQTSKPKCPHCKKRIADWKVDNWQQADRICRCDKCQIETPYKDLNWKQECGFARCGFEVASIYPHEALPSDQLLDSLNKATGFNWDYCYANN